MAIPNDNFCQPTHTRTGSDDPTSPEGPEERKDIQGAVLMLGFIQRWLRSRRARRIALEREKQAQERKEYLL